MSERTIALHFSGHGLKNSEKFGRNQGYKDQGDILIFEKEDGSEYLLTEIELADILRKHDAIKTIEFVFVASCH